MLNVWPTSYNTGMEDEVNLLDDAGVRDDRARRRCGELLTG